MLGIPRRLARVANTGTLPAAVRRHFLPSRIPPNGATRLECGLRLTPGVCCARGRPMMPPEPIKAIATITLLIGVALILAALLY